MCFCCDSKCLASDLSGKKVDFKHKILSKSLTKSRLQEANAVFCLFVYSDQQGDF